MHPIYVALPDADAVVIALSSLSLSSFLCMSVIEGGGKKRESIDATEVVNVNDRRSRRKYTERDEEKTAV